MENSMIEKACPKCGSGHIGCSFSIDEAFEKRGSKIVRKRNVKYVTADWICFTCKHKWSAPACIRGIRFNRGKSRRALETEMLFKDGV